jgi:hypothetical protein
MYYTTHSGLAHTFLSMAGVTAGAEVLANGSAIVNSVFMYDVRVEK